MAGPLVAVKSNAELDAHPELMGQPPVDQPGTEQPNENLITGLSAWLAGLWEIAKRAKIKPEQRMAANIRAKNSEYEPEVLAAIQATIGPNHKPGYMGITSTKCRAGKSWIKDYLFQPNPGQEPWDIAPTPIPELPPSIRMRLFEETKAWVEQQAMEYFYATGSLPDPSLMGQVLQEVLPEAEKRLQDSIRDAAETAAKKMRSKISDQFAEGGWEDALRECVDDLVDIGTMILKGPIFSRSPVLVRDINPATGMYETTIEDRIIQVWKRVNPFHFYPSPDASKTVLPWSFEKMRLTRRDLSELRGQPGFNTDFINEVLQAYDKKGLVEWTNIDQTKHDLEGKSGTSVYETELIDALEFQGSAPGRMLLEWGMSPDLVDDPDKEYNIQAWKIGRWVIKAMLNPDPLGKKNVFFCGFAENNDSFWHKGIPELVETVQTIGNAAVRSLRMNVAMASGPQIEVDKQRLAPGEKGGVVPYKVWYTTSAGMMESAAIKFYQPQMVTEKLIGVFEFCLGAADDDTGIPRYFYTGETRGGKAGDTVGGLQLLMSNASKGLKAVIQAIDTGVIRPSVQTQYHYNLQFEEDPGIIGDLRIIAKGSAILQAREQNAVRKLDMLERTNNPVDNQILGLRGRAMMLRGALESVGLDADKVLEEEEKIQKLTDGIRALTASGMPLQQATQMAMQMGASGQPGEVGPGRAPSSAMRQVDAAGQPVAGRDNQTNETLAGTRA